MIEQRVKWAHHINNNNNNNNNDECINILRNKNAEDDDVLND